MVLVNNIMSVLTDDNIYEIIRNLDGISIVSLCNSNKKFKNYCDNNISKLANSDEDLFIRVIAGLFYENAGNETYKELLYRISHSGNPNELAKSIEPGLHHDHETFYYSPLCYVETIPQAKFFLKYIDNYYIIEILEFIEYSNMKPEVLAVILDHYYENNYDNINDYDVETMIQILFGYSYNINDDDEFISFISHIPEDILKLFIIYDYDEDLDYMDRRYVEKRNTLLINYINWTEDDIKLILDTENYDLIETIKASFK